MPAAEPKQPWLRTNGVNTNGVTAKILFVDGFKQVSKMMILGSGAILHATKHTSKKRQPWIDPVCPLLTADHGDVRGAGVGDELRVRGGRAL